MKALILIYHENLTIKLKNNLREVAERKGKINIGEKALIMQTEKQ